MSDKAALYRDILRKLPGDWYSRPQSEIGAWISEIVKKLPNGAVLVADANLLAFGFSSLRGDGLPEGLLGSESWSKFLRIIQMINEALAADGRNDVSVIVALDGASQGKLRDGVDVTELHHLIESGRAPRLVEPMSPRSSVWLGRRGALVKMLLYLGESVYSAPFEADTAPTAIAAELDVPIERVFVMTTDTDAFGSGASVLRVGNKATDTLGFFYGPDVCAAIAKLVEATFAIKIKMQSMCSLVHIAYALIKYDYCYTAMPGMRKEGALLDTLLYIIACWGSTGRETFGLQDVRDALIHAFDGHPARLPIKSRPEFFNNKELLPIIMSKAADVLLRYGPTAGLNVVKGSLTIAADRNGKIVQEEVSLTELGDMHAVAKPNAVDVQQLQQLLLDDHGGIGLKLADGDRTGAVSRFQRIIEVLTHFPSTLDSVSDLRIFRRGGPAGQIIALRDKEGRAHAHLTVDGVTDLLSDAAVHAWIDAIFVSNGQRVSVAPIKFGNWRLSWGYSGILPQIYGDGVDQLVNLMPTGGAFNVFVIGFKTIELHPTPERVSRNVIESEAHERVQLLSEISHSFSAIATSYPGSKALNFNTGQSTDLLAYDGWCIRITELDGELFEPSLLGRFAKLSESMRLSILGKAERWPGLVEMSDTLVRVTPAEGRAALILQTLTAEEAAAFKAEEQAAADRALLDAWAEELRTMRWLPPPAEDVERTIALTVLSSRTIAFTNVGTFFQGVNKVGTYKVLATLWNGASQEEYEVGIKAANYPQQSKSGTYHYWSFKLVNGLFLKRLEALGWSGAEWAWNGSRVDVREKHLQPRQTRGREVK